MVEKDKTVSKSKPAIHTIRVSITRFVQMYTHRKVVISEYNESDTEY